MTWSTSGVGVILRHSSQAKNSVRLLASYFSEPRRARFKASLLMGLHSHSFLSMGLSFVWSFQLDMDPSPPGLI